MCNLRILFATLRADALDNVFGFFNLEASRKGNGRNADIVKTIGAMTLATSEVDMAMTVARVVEMADTILLRTGTIVNTM